MARADIDSITATDQPATFENTFVPLEKSGEALERLEAIFQVHASNLNLGPIPDIESCIAKKSAAQRDWVVQNESLFDRVKAVQNSDGFGQLSRVQQRLVDECFKSFVRRGADLSADQKAEL